MKKGTIILYSISAICVLIAFIGLMWWSIGEPEVRITKCYDRDYNEIIGQECLENYIPMNKDQVIMIVGLPLGMVMFFISSFVHATEREEN